MADNFTWEESSTGLEFAADEVSGVLYQRVKLVTGADGAADGDLDTGQATMANSLPVALASDQSTVPVSMGVAAGRTLLHSVSAYTASQTAATVYTPTSGKKLVVVHLVVSASAAGTIKLFDNTDTAWNAWSPILSLAANGGWEAHFYADSPLIMSAANNVLKYTSGSGAAGSIWLHGWEE